MAEHSAPADATLVAAIRGGDTAAWGDVFDQHRDAVLRTALAITRNRSDAEDVMSATFLRGVETLDQLREPELLRPWLLSIARRRALDSVRPSRRRETPGDEVGLYEPAPDAGDALDGLHREEQRELVADALEALEPRDRVALEFADAQDLDGQDLADALGISRNNAYALVHNARERFATAVGAVLVARHGRARCAELDGVLSGWDGHLDPRLRKRVNRHIRGCDVCEETRGRSTSPSALLGVAPIALAPTVIARLREQTIAAAAGGSAASAVPGGGSAVSMAGGSGGAMVGGSGGAMVGKVAVMAIAAIAGVAAVVGVVVVTGSSESDDGAVPPVTTDVNSESTEPVIDPDDELDASSVTVARTASTAPDAVAAMESDPEETSASTTTAPAVPTDSTAGSIEPVATTATVLDRCSAVEELKTFGSAGPAATSGPEFTAYLTGVLARLDDVVTALGDDASATVLAYQAAYTELVALGIDDAAALPELRELGDLRDQVEAELEGLCP